MSTNNDYSKTIVLAQGATQSNKRLDDDEQLSSKNRSFNTTVDDVNSEWQTCVKKNKKKNEVSFTPPNIEGSVVRGIQQEFRTKKLNFPQSQGHSQGNTQGYPNQTKQFNKIPVIDSAAAVQVKKKCFSQKPSSSKSSEQVILPDYYKTRMGNSQFEIPQNNYDWVKKVGGIEKCDKIENMFLGAMQCSILFFETYMRDNLHFKQKITPDFADNTRKQDEIMDEICLQTTAILFHRLIKSDTVETVKMILTNLPLYSVVDQTNTLKDTIGGRAYHRVRSNYIRNLKITKRRINNATDLEIAEAPQFITVTNKRWLDYILQSVWNGNNPTHDCLYYGASKTFETLLDYYIKLKMNNELQKMLTEPNGQNETHSIIIENGQKACEKQSYYILRVPQFEKCTFLYNNTIKLLQQKIQNDDDNDSDIEYSIVSDNNDSSAGDDVNVIDLIQKNDYDGMISFVKKNKDNHDIINKTFNIWDTIVKSDKSDNSEVLNECLEEVRNNEDIMSILKSNSDDLSMMIKNAQIEKMIKYIIENSEYQTAITEAFIIWESLVELDENGIYEDYLNDVKDDESVIQILQKMKTKTAELV